MPHRDCKSVQVHVTRDRVHVRGAIHQDLRVVVDSAFRSLLSQPGPRSLDLLQIAAGVYAVDRAVKRQPHAGNESGIRTLNLRFAVNDLEFWQQPDVAETVTQILCFLTDENWHVSFASAGTDCIATTHQEKLDLHWTSRPQRIALYSGGLDSAAGLANRVLAGFDNYLLVTVGHHARLRRQCDEQIRQLSELTGTPRQMHATLVVRQSGGVAKRISQQERTQRSRAFLFAASAAVVAQACDIQKIEVFENGVGAINLPLMTGMLAGGLATRGAHPTFLKLMSQLTSFAFERSFSYVLPFFKCTKAEMVYSLISHGLGEWLQLSRSCVHTSLRERNLRHCGQCPGCIERRQAFAAAGVSEKVYRNYKIDLLLNAKLTPGNADYLLRYLDDARSWLGCNDSIRQRLAWHLSGTNIDDDLFNSIARQQRRHSKEAIRTLGHLTAQRPEAHIPSSRNVRDTLFEEVMT